MANNLQLAINYFNDPNNLYQVARHSLLTQDMDRTTKFEIIGANAVKIRSKAYSVNTPSTYSRSNGTTMVDVTGGWITYMLSKDWGNSLKIDVMDTEESAGETVISDGNDFVRRVWVPSMDQYRLNTLVAAAPVTTTTTGVTLTKTTILDEIKKVLRKMYNSGISETDEKVLYITFSAKAVLEAADNITHFLNWENRNDEIHTRVAWLDECRVVGVPDNYFTATVAVDPVPASKPSFIIVTLSKVNCVVKFNQTKVLASDVLAGFFGVQIDMRLYHDIFPIKTVLASGIEPTADQVQAEDTAATKLIVATPGIGKYVESPYTAS